MAQIAARASALAAPKLVNSTRLVGYSPPEPKTAPRPAPESQSELVRPSAPPREPETSEERPEAQQTHADNGAEARAQTEKEEAERLAAEEEPARGYRVEDELD